MQKNVPDCIILLAGNKLDLESQRKVMQDQAKEYAAEKDCPLIEVCFYILFTLTILSNYSLDRFLAKPEKTCRNYL